MGFPRQKYWTGLPFASSGDLHDPEIEPPSPILAGGFFTIEPPGKPIMVDAYYCIFAQTQNVQYQEQTLI